MRIAVGILAAATTVVAAGEAVRSSGGTSPPTQLTPLALSTTSATAANRIVSTSVDQRRRVDIDQLRAQWLDAENQIRAAGAAMGQRVQQAVTTRNGPAIAAALNQEVADVSAQDQRVAALLWPASIKPHIDAFESSSTAALNQLRSAASNPFGYDANQVNTSIAAFNDAANVVRRDLGLPPD